MKPTQISYKCACMTTEVLIDVPGRRPGEDVVTWMERIVRPWLGEDHRLRSPFCQAKAVEYLKLPLPEDGRRIGDPRQNLN